MSGFASLIEKTILENRRCGEASPRKAAASYTIRGGRAKRGLCDARLRFVPAAAAAAGE
jgi:hypothetical protein